MNIKNTKSSNFEIKVEFNCSQLQEKLNVLSALKSSLFENGANSVFLKSIDFVLNKFINDSNIFTCEYLAATNAGETNKLVCVLDFNIVNFLRECVIAMRTFNRNGSFHNCVSYCKGK